MKLSAFNKSIYSALGIVLLSATTQVHAVSDVPLPDPDAAGVLYGDFYSYSLPILAFNYDAIFGGGVGPGNPFYVASGPGQIQNDIVIATGANGKGVNENFVGMNDAYETPNSDGITYMTTGETGPNDASLGGLNATQNDGQYWNSTIEALDAYLNGSNNFPTFLFNNNQTKSGGAIDQNMTVWMQVILWDSTGGTTDREVFTLSNQCHDLSALGLPTNNLCISGGSVNTDTAGGIVAGAAKDPALYQKPEQDNQYPDPSAPGVTPVDDDFVISGGKVCLSNITTLPVDCGAADAGAPFDHNLGANQAAYAVISTELNDQLSSWRAEAAGFKTYDMMSVDLRLGCNPDGSDGVTGGGDDIDCTGKSLNNGYEQVFLGRSQVDVESPPLLQSIPVPPSLVLFASGGLLMAFKKRRSIAA